MRQVSGVSAANAFSGATSRVQCTFRTVENGWRAGGERVLLCEQGGQEEGFLESRCRGCLSMR